MVRTDGAGAMKSIQKSRLLFSSSQPELDGDCESWRRHAKW